MLLEVKGLRVHYGAVEAVKGVSFDAEEGTLVSLIGANGAGKTTILRTLCGLHRATSGEIWFRGQRIDRSPIPRIVRMGIAHVPEGRRIFPYMSVLDNLRLGAYTIGDRNEKTRLLEEVYGSFPVLKERSKQQAGSLSGGEQQMLAFGRALMTRPDLLLLDEPTLGLSPLVVEEIGNIIRSMRMGRHVAMVLAEQNAQLAIELADKVCVLELGDIVLEGESKDVMDNEFVKRAYLGR